MKPLKSAKSILLLCLFLICILGTTTSCTDLELDEDIDTIENTQSTGEGDGQSPDPK